MLSAAELVRRAIPLDVAKTVKGVTIELLQGAAQGAANVTALALVAACRTPSWRQQTFCLILTGYGPKSLKWTCGGSRFHLGYGTTLS
jgi:hypothetical protein